MTDLELAKELVSILPVKGGCRRGMLHDILHAFKEIRKQAYNEGIENASKIVGNILKNYQYETLEERLDKTKYWSIHRYLIQEDIQQSLRKGKVK